MIAKLTQKIHTNPLFEARKGSHKEENRREKRQNESLMSSLARPAFWKGASFVAAAASLGLTVRLECTSVQPSLHLVRGLQFDDSAASRLPERFGQLFEKHCLSQTTLVFILCLLSRASSEMKHLRKSDPNFEELVLPLVPSFQRQLNHNRDCFTAKHFSSDVKVVRYWEMISH